MNSMKTKLTQTIFFFYFVVILFDHMNSGLFNTTEDLKSGFQNLETSAYWKSREEKLTICVSGYECCMTHSSRSIPLISRRKTCPLNSRICNNFNENSKYLGSLNGNYSKQNGNGNTIWSGGEIQYKRFFWVYNLEANT